MFKPIQNFLIALLILCVTVTGFIYANQPKENNSKYVSCQSIVNEIIKREFNNTVKLKLQTRFFESNCGKEYKILPFTPFWL